MADGFTVITDPSRRQILDLLLAAERDVNELVGELGVAQPNVSKHLRVLREAGLVRMRIDGPRRVYALDPTPLAELDAWLAPYRHFWAARLDALGDHLNRSD